MIIYTLSEALKEYHKEMIRAESDSMTNFSNQAGADRIKDAIDYSLKSGLCGPHIYGKIIVICDPPPGVPAVLVYDGTERREEKRHVKGK